MERPRGDPPRGLSRVWVLADPRAGTAAQALGIAERLGWPFRTIPLQWGIAAGLPIAWPSLAGLDRGSRALLAPPWPELVIAAGRRSAPVARWLGTRGARLVQCMRPGFGAGAFDLLVIGRHDEPRPAKNLLPILGATHRLSAAALAVARNEWAEFAALPRPRVALLLGADPAAGALAARIAGFAGSVLATTSRRTDPVAGDAVAAALTAVPHRLHRWGTAGANPYRGMLAWADAVVVTADSVSMVSEALATAVPVYLADPGRLGVRHRRLWSALLEAGAARDVAQARTPFVRTALDETARVAAEITRWGLG